MALPLEISQPTLALSLAVVNNGIFPGFFHGPSESGALEISTGFIATTAFDAQRINDISGDPNEVLLPSGQTLPIQSNTILYSLVGNTYGGDGQTVFELPNLLGAAPTYSAPASSVEPLLGQINGVPGNLVTVEYGQLPAALGGAASPIDNDQYGIGMQYLIRTAGLFPSGDTASFATIGTVHPFVGSRVPDGFMRADGSLLDVQEFPALFAVLGDTYGGDGQSTFALPDLRNRIPVGTGTTENGQEIQLGQLLGSDQIELTAETVQGLSAINTMQPSIGMHYVVSTSGNYASLPVDGSESMLGQVILYAGVQNASTEDWVFAQGQSLSVSANAALYSLLGHKFGSSEAGTFRLPNLIGRTIIAAEDDFSIGETGGSTEIYFSPSNVPPLNVPTPSLELVNLQGELIDSGVVNSPFQLSVDRVLWPLASLEFSNDGQNWSQDYTLVNGTNTIYARQVTLLGSHSEASAPVTLTLDSSTFESVYAAKNPDNFGYLPQLATFDGLACTPTSTTNALVYLVNQANLSGTFNALSDYSGWVSVRDTLATNYFYTSSNNGDGLPDGTLPAQALIGLSQYLQDQNLGQEISISALGISTDAQGNNIAGWGTAANSQNGRPAIGPVSDYTHLFTEGAVTGEFLRAGLLRSDAVILGGFYSDSQGNPEGHAVIVTELNWTDKNANGVMDASDGAQMTILDPLDPAQAYDPKVDSNIGYGTGDTEQQRLDAALNQVQSIDGPLFKTGDVFENDAGMLVFSYPQFSLENVEGTLSLVPGDSSNGRPENTDMTIMLAMSLGVSGLPNNIDQALTENMPVATFQFSESTLGGKDISGKIYSHEESAFSNKLQFYRLDSADGSIIDPVSGQRLMPGDDGYVQAALALAEEDVLNTSPRLSGDFEQFQRFDLSDMGDLLIAPVVTTSEQNHWFAFEQANSDGMQHFKALSALTYGVEDQSGLGDRDFDDLIFQIIPMQMG